MIYFIHVIITDECRRLIAIEYHKLGGREASYLYIIRSFEHYQLHSSLYPHS